MIKIVFICVGFFFCLSSHASLADRQKEIEIAEKSAFSPEKKLTFLSDSVDSIGVFNFGQASLMDNTQELADDADIAALRHNLPGIKHLFVLQNQTKVPLTISDLRPDCICIRADIVDGEKIGDLPYVVEPGAKVNVKVGFNYYSVAAGSASAKIDLSSPGLKTPLATLIMRGQVRGGIESTVREIDFGTVPSNQGADEEFSLIFDRRVTEQMVPSLMRLISRNPYVKITSAPVRKNVMGVEVNNDTILFPKSSKFLNDDLKLDFRISLSEDAPVGTVIGEVGLIMPQFPRFMLTKSIKIPIRGKITGHLRSAPLSVLVLVKTVNGQMKQTTNIICMTPLKVEDLQVETSDPLLQAELLPLQEKKQNTVAVERKVIEGQALSASTLLKEGEQGLVLNISLEASAPIGEFRGKITVTNKINKEKLELPVFAKKSALQGGK